MAIARSVLLLYIVVFLQGLLVTLAGKGPVVPAVFIFGDSIVDTGTNNVLPTITKCNFPPYGKDFPTGQPNGRFCNGKVPSDLLASTLGVKELVPPYRGTNLPLDELLTGVCFASGGSGFDDMSSRLLGALTMTEQLNDFKEYKEKLIKVAGEERAGKTISEGLYISACGSDDFLNNYFGPTIRSKQYNVSSYADLLVSSASDFLRGLSQLGARKIGFIGIPPIGCLPLQRTAQGINRECYTVHNDAARLFNSKMQDQIAKLPSDASLANGTRVVFLDVYDSFLDLIQKPSRYGFDESTKGCCGTGEFEVSILCNHLSSVCEDDTKYVFWDGYHATERAYRIIVDVFYKKYIQLLV